MAALALVAVEHRAPAVELDQRGDQQQQGREQQQGQRRQRALQHRLPGPYDAIGPRSRRAFVLGLGGRVRGRRRGPRTRGADGGGAGGTG